MAKKLVIVESPTKAKTIRKFLGGQVQVIASEGHIRDLPKSRLGVDIENDFTPQYITIRGKGELLAELKSAAKKADQVYLATDPDREGEAISWHLSIALGLEKAVNRVTFNEITKTAVKEAMKHPRPIDEALVDAQQARRVLDRIVGYQISPILWKNVKKGLSAGRVQSACLHLLCEREMEIEDFEQKEFWTIEGTFETAGDHKKLTLGLTQADGKKLEIGSEEEAAALLEEIKSISSYRIREIKTGHRIRRSPDAFTTSTLQQEASRKLGFSPQKTMSLAQALYEGVELEGHGLTGLITYLRTDSTRIAEEMQENAARFIEETFGKAYQGDGRKEKKGGRIQDAHEAIRPTDLSLSPQTIADSLSRDQLRLYQLIYNRFLASRMASAQYLTQHIAVEGGRFLFEAAGSVLDFPGFMKVYSEDTVDEGALKGLDQLKEGESFILKDVDKAQHFTQPPARYTEGLLVRAMEENGVGRPSTYAPTISTLIGRGYVTKEKKALYVTELGSLVRGLISEYFESIDDISFTAHMENELDRVEEGELDWKEVLRSFYQTFKPQLEKAEAEMEKVVIEDEVTDEICDKCGRNMVLKIGRFGKFYACPGFPECRNTKPYLEKIGVTCEKCGGQILVKRSKKGRIYYGCENNPTCDFMSWEKPTGKICPACGGRLYEKQGRVKKLVCLNQDCRYTQIEEES